jgi:hypothetical protein
VHRRAATPGLACLALLAGLGAAVSAAPGPARDGEQGETGALVEVRLATAAQLAPLARATLIHEVTDIWRREGVRLRWPLDPATSHAPDFALRVLVVQREIADGDAGRQWPVGELRFDQSDNPVAVASIDAAERIIDTAAGNDEPATMRARRLGTVLGRTVAHEMGHYLLNTASHARRGLMRARIDTNDFADLRSGAFFLDGPAGEWIRSALIRTATAQTRLARFVYAP